jgi:glycosyltransferase involved in cell wall biosynthesis
MVKKCDHFLSVVIPCYKQEKIIVKNIKQILETLAKIRYNFEIIIVVDGRVDDSFNFLKKARLDNVKIYQYEKNHGKSFAIRFGLSKARGDYLMFMDSGMEIDPNGISMLIEHLEWYQADIIIGSKRHPASKVSYPINRKILSYGYYYFIKLLFGLKVRDTQAGIKIFRKEVLKKVLPRLVEKKFAGDLEILTVANLLGFNKIYEAPIKLTYTDKAFSSAIKFNSIFNIFVDTLAIFYRKNILRYYQGNKFKSITLPKFEFYENK